MAISGGDGSIVLTTKIDESGLKNGLSKLKSGIGSFGKAFATAGQAAAAAFVAAGVAAIKLGADFEQSAAKASTLFGDVAVDTDNLNKKILELSSSTGVAATELNESLYSALSAGIPATEDMSEALGILEGSTKLAKAGFTDIDTALSATAKTLNAYGLETTEAERIQGILIQTQNKGITTVGELGASLAQVTPTAAAFNVSFENVGAALATMTAQGTPTAQATTQLNSLIAELGKQGTVASENLMKAAEGTKYAGMSFSEMTASGASLGDILTLIANEADKNGVSMVDMFSSIEAGKAALSIASGEAKTFNSNLEAMANTSGLLDEAYGKVTKTLSSQTSILKESFKNLGIAIGTGGDVDTAIQNLSTSFVNFSSIALPVVQKTTQGILQAFQGLLPQLTSAVSSMLPVVIEGVSGIITGITQVLPQIVDAVVGLLPQLIDGIMQISDGLIGALPQILQSILLALPALIPQLVDGSVSLIMMLVEMLPQIIQPIIDNLPEIITSITGALIDNLPILIQGAIQLVVALVAALPQIIMGLLEAMGIVALQIGEALFNALPGPVQDAFKAAFDAIKAIWDLVSPYFEMVWGNIKAIFSVVGAVLSGFFNVAWTLIKTIWDNVTGYFRAIWETIASIFSVVAAVLSGNWQDAWDAIRGIVDTWVGYFQSVWDGIKNIFSAVIGYFTGVFSAAWNAIKDIWSNVIGFFSGIWSGIQGAFSSVTSWFSEKFSAAKNAILNVFSNIGSQFNEIGMNIVRGIGNGITSGLSWIKNLITGWVGNVKAFIKNLFGIRSPSRWAKEVIGKNIMLGFANGLTENDSVVFSAMKKVTSGLENTNFATPNIVKGNVLPYFANSTMSKNTESINGNNKNNYVSERIIEEHYYLNETELMTLIYKMAKGGERLKGKSLITVGG